MRIKDLNALNIGPPGSKNDFFCIGIVLANGAPIIKMLVTDFTSNHTQNFKLDRPDRSIAREVEKMGLSRNDVIQLEISSNLFEKLAKEYEDTLGLKLLDLKYELSGSTFRPLARKFCMIAAKTYFSYKRNLSEPVVTGSINKVSLIFTNEKKLESNTDLLDNCLESPLFKIHRIPDTNILTHWLKRKGLVLKVTLLLKNEEVKTLLQYDSEIVNSNRETEPEYHIKEEELPLIQESVIDDSQSNPGSNQNINVISESQSSKAISPRLPPSQLQAAAETGILNTLPVSDNSQIPALDIASSTQLISIEDANKNLERISIGYNFKVRAYISGWSPHNLTHICSKTYFPTGELGDPTLIPLEFYLTSVPPSCNGPPTILDESNLLVARIDEESILDFFNAESIERLYINLNMIQLQPNNIEMFELIIKKRSLGNTTGLPAYWTIENLNINDIKLDR